MTNRSNIHESVLKEQVIEALNVKSNGCYVDCTLGRAGHSKEILKLLNSNGKLIGIDRDAEAIKYSKDILQTISKNFTLIKDNYSNLKNIFKSIDVESVDGILYDLGVSSPQLDNAERGFSYRYDSKLDMRMDQSQKLDAHYVVNNYTQENLERIFWKYAESKYARKLSQSIINSRPINSTFELVNVIKSSLPAFELRKSGHPAKKYFQAIRIEVNDELNSLKISLQAAVKLLKVNGRICTISFHSLEDIIIKNFFKELTTSKIPRDLPIAVDDVNYKIIKIKNAVPTVEEIQSNNRSRSAKLRVIEKIKESEYYE